MNIKGKNNIQKKKKKKKTLTFLNEFRTFNDRAGRHIRQI